MKAFPSLPADSLIVPLNHIQLEVFGTCSTQMEPIFKKENAKEIQRLFSFSLKSTGPNFAPDCIVCAALIMEWVFAYSNLIMSLNKTYRKKEIGLDRAENQLILLSVILLLRLF